MNTPTIQRPGFSFFVCPDSELIKIEIDIQLKKYKPNQDEWKRIIFWGDEEPDSKYWKSISQQGFFTEYRAVIVRNAQHWNAATWKQIEKTLSKGFDQIWPIFCIEVEQEKGKFKIPTHIQKSQCMLFAEKNHWVWNKPGLNETTLQKFTVENAKLLGLSFNTDALSLFCSSIKNDACAVMNELKKLSLMTHDGKISMDMISIGSQVPESNAFICVRNLLSGNLTGAWKEMSRGDANTILFFLIALLSRELRLLWKIVCGENPYMYPAEAPVKKRIASKLGFKNLAEGFSLLAEAEWQVKSGSRTPAQVLENLAIKIATMFKSAQ